MILPKDDPSAKSIKEDLIDVSSLICVASRNEKVRTPCVVPSNGDMISLAESAHFQNARPEHVLPPYVIAVDRPSSATWSQMEMATPGVKQALAEQIDDKKAELNEKKYEWRTFLENYRDMILNFTSKDGKSTSVSPTKELLGVMSCTTSAEAETKVRSTLKVHGTRVKLPLIIIIKTADR